MALSRPIPLQSRQAMASLLSDPPSLVAAVSLRPGAGPSPSSAGTRRSTGAGQAQRAQARPAVPCVILASLSSSSSPKRASKTHPAVSATPPSAAAAAAAAAAGASSVLSPPPPAPTPAPAPTPKLPREPNGTASHYGEAASSPAAASVASPGLGIVEFLRGKNIIITGATGFLAKVLVEKILREQPAVGCLYLVIQPRSDANAQQRLAQQVNGSQIFDRLREQHGEEYSEFMSKKLVAVEGNLCKEKLGIDEATAEELKGCVDVIVNSAATTTFDERYDFALQLNTLGPKRIMEFAQDCPNLKLFLHVSTAYVNGLREGWTAERPFEDGDCIMQELRGEGAVKEPLSVDAELALAQRELERVEAETRATAVAAAAAASLDPSDEGSSPSVEDTVAAAVQRHMVELGMRRAQQYGWQDTYVFTKSMGEMMLSRYLKKSKFAAAVVRPSIVESSTSEPLRGWIEGLRMADPILLAYGKGQMSGFLGNPDSVLDMIPADYVINALLAVMTKEGQKPAGSLTVYQVATGVANPLLLSKVASATSDHFRETPFMQPREGGPIRVNPMKLFRYPIFFAFDIWFKYQLPLQLAALKPGAKKGFSEKRNNLMLKTAEQLSYLAKIYAPYTFYACRFDSSNLQSLMKDMSEEEKARFNIDLKTIDWQHYLVHTHLPGLRKYVLKGRGSENQKLF